MWKCFGVSSANGGSRFARSPIEGTAALQSEDDARFLPWLKQLVEPDRVQQDKASPTKGDMSTIRWAATELEKVASGSENDFLSLGESLQEFYTRVKEIHQIGESSAALMSGQEIMGSIELLLEMTGEMKIILKQSEGRQERNLIALRRVIACLNSVRRHLEGFNKIIISLRFLGITTKIETSQLARSQEVFHALADQVIEQSEKIDSKVTHIASELSSLSNQVNRTLARFLELDATQRGQGRRVIDDIAVTLTSLSDKQNESSLAARRISSLAKEISRDMGEIVSSMQFHDITRQRIEHVQQALAELSEESPAGQVHDVCGLQSFQIRHARTGLTSAVQKIISCLRDIGQNITNLSLETLRLIGSASQDGSSFLSEMERKVSSATDSLREYHQISGELLEAMTSVAHTLEAMADFLKDIDGIGYSIKCIALNSAVKANVVGKEGSTIEVVSRGMLELSQNASAQVEEISGAIKEVTGVIQSLREGMADEAKREDSEVGAFTEKMGQMVQTVRLMNERSLEQLARIDQSSLTLASDIEKTANGITMHEAMERKLDDAALVLEQVSASTAHSAEAEPASRDRDLVLALAGQYTMQKERDIHLSWARESGKTSPVDAERDKPDGKSGDDELGDNVELF